MLTRILKEEQAEIVAASSGDEAMEIVARTPPDLVLLDLMMPGMSGFELVARLRAQPKGRAIPIMIVSAKELTADDMLTLDGHVQRFVAKGSIEPQGLTNAVRQLLGQSTSQGAAA
jgi:CheY-like chemotaxis protein